jgi:hypothetical protein
MPSRSAKDGTELEFNSESIDSLIAEVRKLKAASVGIQRTPVEYQRTPPLDE